MEEKKFDEKWWQSSFWTRICPYEFGLVAKKFVRIRKKGENLFNGGLYKNDNTILPMFFYICLGFIWHPNAGVGYMFEFIEGVCVESFFDSIEAAV